MAIAFDGFGSGKDVNLVGTIGGVHTIAKYNNTILLAWFTKNSNSGSITLSPSFAGNSFNKLFTGTNSSGTAFTTEVWYLQNPPTGIGTILGTWSNSSRNKNLFSISLTGVDFTNLISGSFTSIGTTVNSGSISTTLLANQFLVAGMSIMGTPSIGTTAIGNERGTIYGGTLSIDQEGIGVTNTGGTIQWTFANQSFVALGLNLNPALYAGTNLIQSTGTSAVSSTALSASWGGATTTGNMIAVGVTITNAASLGTVTSISDTQGNTYTRAIKTAGTATKVVDTELWFAQNIIGGAGSVTVNLSSNAVSMYVREYSGKYNVLDQTSSAVGSSAAINAGTTATVTQNNELIIGVTGDEKGGTQTYQAAGPYGDMVGTTTTATGVCMYDNIVNTGGAQTGTNTMTVADEWVSVMATFMRVSNTGYNSSVKGNSV